MKKIKLLLMVMMLLTACQKDVNQDKLLVSVSFYPISYFTQAIGKEHIEVFNVLDQGSDAHDYEPSIQDRIKIESSDIFIHNGFHLEHWVEKTLESINNHELLVVDTSENIEPLLRKNDPDPHIWLDPFLAEVQVDNIYASLIQKDPQNKEDYEANYRNLKEQFSNLQKEFDETLSGVEGQSIVLEHEIFSYIEERYGLKQISVSGILPEGEPSLQQLNKVLDKIKERNIQTLLLSKYDSSKVIETIAKETETNVLLIDSMEIGKEDFDYFEIMRENLNVIKEALSDE